MGYTDVLKGTGMLAFVSAARDGVDADATDGSSVLDPSGDLKTAVGDPKTTSESKCEKDSQ